MVPSYTTFEYEYEYNSSLSDAKYLVWSQEISRAPPSKPVYWGSISPAGDEIEVKSAPFGPLRESDACDMAVSQGFNIVVQADMNGSLQPRREWKTNRFRTVEFSATRSW